MSVLLPFVAPSCFLVRRTRRIGALADLPVIAFVLSVLLLGFGPSKWIWHFGVLAPIAAAAVAVELHRLQLDRENTKWVTPGLGIAAVGALAATALAWRGGFNWQEVALIRWMDDQSPPQLLGRLLSNPLILLAAVGVAVGARGLLIQRREVPKQVVRLSARWVIPWLLPVTASISVLTAVSSFAIDGLVLAPGWSLAKQNLGLIPGSSCGLGDDVFVPEMNQSLLALLEDREGPVLMAPQVAMYFPCLSQPVIEGGVASLPTAILAVGVVPLGFGGSPYHYLSDIAHLERLNTAQASTGTQLPIDVILVEPVLTVGE